MFRKSLLAGLISVGLAGTASAAPLPFLDGSLAFSALETVNVVGSGGTLAAGNWLIATGIDFAVGDGGKNFFVLNGTGMLMSLAPKMTQGSQSDLTFSPLSLPIANFFTVGPLSFTLTSLGTDVKASSIVLAGQGTLSAQGYADTIGQWQFSTQGPGEMNFSWSSGVAIPAPGVAALLGVGVLALGIAARRRIGA